LAIIKASYRRCVWTCLFLWAAAPYHRKRTGVTLVRLRRLLRSGRGAAFISLAPIPLRLWPIGGSQTFPAIRPWSRRAPGWAPGGRLPRLKPGNYFCR
jgi:hypothetical protein